jgi:hypothetical protein
LVSLPYQQRQKAKQQNKETTTETSSFNSSSIFDLFRNKPFWLWDKQEHRQQFIAKDGSRCLIHITGLPVNNGKEFTLFDYERLLFDSLLKADKSFKDKHLWVLKSTGFGITEFLELFSTIKH